VESLLPIGRLLLQLQVQGCSHPAGQPGQRLLIMPLQSDKVKSETRFKIASDMERVTRAAADPLNLRIPAPPRSEKELLLTESVPNSWNKISQALKKATTAKAFRNEYQKHRQTEAIPDGDQMMTRQADAGSMMS
jgi:hypothetical protein